jgi:hypothetical protein
MGPIILLNRRATRVRVVWPDPRHAPTSPAPRRVALQFGNSCFTQSRDSGSRGPASFADLWT